MGLDDYDLKLKPRLIEHFTSITINERLFCILFLFLFFVFSSLTRFVLKICLTIKGGIFFSY